eukprot:gene19979-biopygen1005
MRCVHTCTYTCMCTSVLLIMLAPPPQFVTYVQPCRWVVCVKLEKGCIFRRLCRESSPPPSSYRTRNVHRLLGMTEAKDKHRNKTEFMKWLESLQEPGTCWITKRITRTEVWDSAYRCQEGVAQERDKTMPIPQYTGSRRVDDSLRRIYPHFVRSSKKR